jgi:hypothetical protein
MSLSDFPPTEDLFSVAWGLMKDGATIANNYGYSWYDYFGFSKEAKTRAGIAHDLSNKAKKLLLESRLGSETTSLKNAATLIYCGKQLIRHQRADKKYYLDDLNLAKKFRLKDRLGILIQQAQLIKQLGFYDHRSKALQLKMDSRIKSFKNLISFLDYKKLKKIIINYYDDEEKIVAAIVDYSYKQKKYHKTKTEFENAVNQNIINDKKNLKYLHDVYIKYYGLSINPFYDEYEDRADEFKKYYWDGLKKYLQPLAADIMNDLEDFSLSQQEHEKIIAQAMKVEKKLMNFQAAHYLSTYVDGKDAPMLAPKGGCKINWPLLNPWNHQLRKQHEKIIKKNLTGSGGGSFSLKAKGYGYNPLKGI